jgi:hypothetical protein
MATQKDVQAAAAQAGLNVRTYSPGDGVTRYRFFPKDDTSSYFGPSNGIHTALGAKAAIEYAEGCVDGQEVNIKYKIVRFYRNRQRNRQTIHSNVTLEVAQLHCNDPRTRKEGIYFDGYERM